MDPAVGKGLKPAPRKVYFLVPYPPGVSPSQRFRFELFLPLLAASGFKVRVSPFITEKYWKTLYRPGNLPAKILATLRGYLQRFIDLFRAAGSDIVFIHREAAPFGPPVFEFILRYVLNKKIIYDFDDAIWLPAESANKLATWFKSPSKVSKICAMARVVSCGNAYIAEWARPFNKNARIIPTVVDTEHRHCRIQDQDTAEAHIGWTGSHTTMTYLKPLLPVLRKLEKSFRFRFFVISNVAPDWELDSLHFIPWNKATEIRDLLSFHIGVMPLEEDSWSKGKCGFKAIQYMALGIPALVSPVGVNTEIVDHGKNGYHCTTGEAWYQYLSELLADADRRAAMGIAARKKIEENYSVKSLSAGFLQMFECL